MASGYLVDEKCTNYSEQLFPYCAYISALSAMSTSSSALLAQRVRAYSPQLSLAWLQTGVRLPFPSAESRRETCRWILKLDFNYNVEKFDLLLRAVWWEPCRLLARSVRDQEYGVAYALLTQSNDVVKTYSYYVSPGACCKTNPHITADQGGTRYPPMPKRGNSWNHSHANLYSHASELYPF